MLRLRCHSLEGWARPSTSGARETERHTERVTEMTMRLARTMGIGDKEARPHPPRRAPARHRQDRHSDSILLKPGPLTDEEWLLMRKHPQLAFEMLQPIAYLRPALDIPLRPPRALGRHGLPARAQRRADPPGGAHLRRGRRVGRPRCRRPALSGPLSKRRGARKIRSLAGAQLDPKAVEGFLKAGGGRICRERACGRSKAVPGGAVNALPRRKENMPGVTGI